MAALKRKNLGSFVIIGILILAFAVPFFGPYAVGLVAFPITYSEGVRIGQVLKLSEKGLIWKTWEGGLGVTQSGAYSEYWDFSVDPNGDAVQALLKDLRRAYDTGKLVKIHYVQHVGIRPWIGKTSFIIDDVEFVREANE